MGWLGMRTGRRIVRNALVFLLPVCTTSAPAQTTMGIAAQLAADLKGNVYVLRQPLKGKTLRYASDGKPLSKLEPGTWPAHSALLVDSVKEERSEIRLECRRVVSYFNPQGEPHIAVTPERLRLQIGLPGPGELGSVYSAFRAIFLTQGEVGSYKPPPRITDFGKDPGVDTHVVGELPNGDPIYRVGKQATPPRPLQTPNPVYPDELRRKRMEGTVVLAVVLDADGNLCSIQVTRSLHPQFDANAAAALTQWVFSPARLDGRPIAVVIDVEINFRLTFSIR